MRLKRRSSSNMLAEPPAVLLTDLAFNLVIFFVVCASTDPQNGRKQVIPKSSKDQSAPAQAAKNLEISLTRDTVAINGVVTRQADFSAKLKELLAQKTRSEDRMVVVKSTKDTLYGHWIRVTDMIEQAGGLIALQVEEGREINVP